MYSETLWDEINSGFNLSDSTIDSVVFLVYQSSSLIVYVRKLKCIFNQELIITLLT